MATASADAVTVLEGTPALKRRRVALGQSTNHFLRSWAWKREHSVRFHQPYEHVLRVPLEESDRRMSIRQAPFDAQGFASTVWDSSIVLAKFLEKQAALAAALAVAAFPGAAAAGSSGAAAAADAPPADGDGAGVTPPAAQSVGQPAADSPAADGGQASAGVAAGASGSAAVEAGAGSSGPAADGAAASPTNGPSGGNRPPAGQVTALGSPASGEGGGAAGFSLRGLRCLDLSAGCGLPGIVMAHLGACVTATDLAPNLPLLRDNCAVNGLDNGASPIRVLEHEWGSSAAALEPPFDVVVACDVMYIDDAVAPLVETLRAVSGANTLIYIAHGRNRQAEASFRVAAEKQFEICEVPGADVDELYQCSDVTVLRLRLRLE